MSTCEIIMFHAAVWNLFGVFCGVCLGRWYELNPVNIKWQYDVGTFGCVLLTILLNLLCPVISVLYWLYKL